MYELICRLTLKQLTQEQLPLLVVALGIAELFYYINFTASFLRPGHSC
jgi:hypothetical protein